MLYPFYYYLFLQEDYISYKYELPEEETKIQKNSTTSMYITVNYNKQVPLERLSQGLYNANLIKFTINSFLF